MYIHMVQVLEALALAEPPPEVQDNLKPDHDWMLSAAKEELESFRVIISKAFQSSIDDGAGSSGVHVMASGIEAVGADSRHCT